jgi:hypothetical protein
LFSLIRVPCPCHPLDNQPTQRINSSNLIVEQLLCTLYPSSSKTTGDETDRQDGYHPTPSSHHHNQPAIRRCSPAPINRQLKDNDNSGDRKRGMAGGIHPPLPVSMIIVVVVVDFD